VTARGAERTGSARVDGLEKVVGTALYVGDLRLPGMLEGRILRSPYAHARILRIDTTRAEHVVGVRAVVTGEDTPKRAWGAFIADQYPLAVDKVRYVGDEVAAVAAVDADTADEAIALIHVEYEELPAVLDPAEAMRPGAPLVHDRAEGNIAYQLRVERGDPDRALASANLVLEETFESHIQWHAALETIGCVAKAGADGKLTFWLNTATPFLARKRIAHALALEQDAVRIIQTAVGGAFGGKSLDDNTAMACGLLAQKCGGTVRILNTREDEFLATRPRVPMRIWVRMGFQRDGTIVAKDLRVVADKGAYGAKGPGVAAVAALRHDLSYRYRDLRSQLYVVYTNKIPTGALRGFGNPSAAWAVEQMVDMGAAALGIDPREMALRNVIEAGHTSQHGHVVRSCELKECVRQATAGIGWSEKRRDRAPGRGLGLAISAHATSQRRVAGDYDGATVVMTITPEGTIHLLCGEGETGSGSTTAWCMLAAGELGVPLGQVSISSADTELGPFSLGSFASRSTYIVGNAVLDGARKLKAAVLELGAELLGADVSDTRMEGGTVSAGSSPGRTITLMDVARHHLHRRGGSPLMAVGTFDAPSEIQDETRFGNESGAYTFTCHAVEVEVDRETGQLRILDYVAATDAGAIINARGARGQIEGAFAQGLGYALLERMQFDGGRPLALNFSDYRMPSMADMPPITTVFVPSYEPSGPLGAKGIGEIAVDPVAPALANAIYDAAGVRITTLPITPEKILAALRRRDATP
jgi:CO/xanthine dehydrogenase Mo-binding subunit